MVICFTGHRDCETHRSCLEGIRIKYPKAKWIHGGAKEGFDLQVAKFIEWDGNIEFQVFRPNYNLYYARYAPIERNHVMVNACDLVVACWDGRGEGGTYDTVDFARQKSKPLEFVPAYQIALIGH